jgi:hypothetical protein
MKLYKERFRAETANEAFVKQLSEIQSAKTNHWFDLPGKTDFLRK